MAMVRLGANRGPRRPRRLTLLGLDCLALKMGAENSSEASVINDCCKGPQSHKTGAFRDDEYKEFIVITPCGLVVLILGRLEHTVSVIGIKCKSEKVVAYMEEVTGNSGSDREQRSIRVNEACNCIIEVTTQQFVFC
jgi:hypothetical protein